MKTLSILLLLCVGCGTPAVYKYSTAVTAASFVSSPPDVSAFNIIATVKGDVVDNPPLGKVELLENSVVLKVQDLSNDSQTVFTLPMAPGNHQYEVLYLGNAVYNTSSTVVYGSF